jgi:hypothetical protein
MSIQKKSLISTLKTTKKANAVASPKEGLKVEKTQNLRMKDASLRMKNTAFRMKK